MVDYFAIRVKTNYRRTSSRAADAESVEEVRTRRAKEVDAPPGAANAVAD
jgi:hypothetical protein